MSHKPKKHKRKGPKNTRSGCLMCKPHKVNGAKHRQRIRDLRKIDPVDISD